MFVRGPVFFVFVFIFFVFVFFLIAKVQLLQIFFCCTFKNGVCRADWLTGYCWISTESLCVQLLSRKSSLGLGHSRPAAV